jgi:hypothetical protein
MGQMNSKEARDVVLRWAVAPAVGVSCFFLAPTVDSQHSPSNLGTFFMTGATLLGTFFIALALLATTSPLDNYRKGQIVGYITFVYIAAGALASVSGTILSWPYAAYSIFFAITSGSGSATVLAVTRVGIENLSSQRQQDIAALARNPGGGRGG